MPYTVRTQILMDPDEIRRLRRISKKRRTSIGKLIRDAVRDAYLRDDTDARTRAVDQIVSMDIGPLPDWAELEEEIDGRHDDVPGHEHRPLRRRRSAPAS